MFTALVTKTSQEVYPWYHSRGQNIFKIMLYTTVYKIIMSHTINPHTKTGPHTKPKVILTSFKYPRSTYKLNENRRIQTIEQQNQKQKKARSLNQNNIGEEISLKSKVINSWTNLQ